MKSVINVLIALSFLCSTISIADPMDQAVEAVNAQQAQAKAKAYEAVAGDFNFALSETIQALVDQHNNDAQLRELLSQQKGLIQSLDSITKLNAEDIGTVRQKTLAAFETYKKVARDRFDLSFQIAENRDSQRQALRLAAMILKQFQSNCSSGKGIGGFGAVAFQYPELPKPQFSVYVGTSNGSISKTDLHYNATGSGTEESRETINNTTAIIASNVYMVGVAGEAGAMTSACAVAGPYAIAAAVVVAAVTSYLNRMDRIKLEDEIVAAETYAFRKSATDKDIGDYYKEQCTQTSSELDPILKVFNTAISHPDQLETLAAPDSFQDDFAKLQEKLAAREVLKSQLAAEKARDKPDSNKIDSIVGQLIQIEHEMAAISTPEHIAGMAIQVLVKRRDNLAANFVDDLQSKLDLAQRAAFQNILRILELLQKHNFMKFVNGKDEIGQEIRGLKEFINAQALLKATLVAQIRFIFGRETKMNVDQAQRALGQATRLLIEKYAQNQEVAEFGLHVRDLIGKY